MTGNTLARAALVAAKQAAKIRFPGLDETKVTRALVIWEDGQVVVRCQYRGDDGKWNTVQVTEEQLDQTSLSMDAMLKL